MLGFDEYEQPREVQPLERLTYTHAKTRAKELWAELLRRLPTWKVAPAVAVRDAEGKPVWGVAWLTAECNRHRVVNLINYRHEPVSITLTAKGRKASGVNRFDDAAVRGPVNLRPLEPLLVQVRQ